MFQQYPQGNVNEPVLLHDGRFRVRSGDQCIKASGSACLRWLPSPGIEFDIETDEPVGLDLGSLTVELPGFATKNVFAYSTAAPGLIRASAAEMEWGGNRRLLSVGFQIVNCPDFITPGPATVPGDPTVVGSCCRARKVAHMWASKKAQLRTRCGSSSGGDLRTGASSGLKGDRGILSSPLNEGGAVFERERRGFWRGTIWTRA